MPGWYVVVALPVSCSPGVAGSGCPVAGVSCVSSCPRWTCALFPITVPGMLVFVETLPQPPPRHLYFLEMDSIEGLHERHQRFLQQVIEDELRQEERRSKALDRARTEEEKKELEGMFHTQRLEAQNRIRALRTEHKRALKKKIADLDAEDLVSSATPEPPGSIATSTVSGPESLPSDLPEVIVRGPMSEAQLEYIRARMATAERGGLDLTGGSGVRL